MMTRRSLAIGGLALFLAHARSSAQEPGRSFLIYFRWNSTVLQPNMQRRILEAARAAQYHRAARIEVTGYTDTSMSDDESMDISMRMAEVVADGLIKQGLKANSIVVSGMGEGNLVKSTADGVIESHNRRVEIKVHQAAQPTEPMVISDARVASQLSRDRTITMRICNSRLVTEESA